MKSNMNFNNGPSDSTELTHAAVQELLPEYATVAAFGNTPQASYPDVAAHLAQCPACRADLDELLTLTLSAYQSEVESAPSYPPPDLARLRQLSPEQNSGGRPWFVDQFQRLVVLFSEAWLLPLQVPTLAGALRSDLLYRYRQERGMLPDLDVTVEVFNEDTAEKTVCVQVTVEATNRGPFAHAGSQVVLRTGEATWRGETDATGHVNFTPVAAEVLPVLRVEITLPPDINRPGQSA